MGAIRSFLTLAHGGQRTRSVRTTRGQTPPPAADIEDAPRWYLVAPAWCAERRPTIHPFSIGAQGSRATVTLRALPAPPAADALDGDLPALPSLDAAHAIGASNDALGTEVGILRSILDAYKEAYRDEADSWKTLEGKAQGSIAIAGIFIAGVFSSARDVGPSTPPMQRVLLLWAVLLLVLAVGYAVLALRVVQVMSPPRQVHAVAQIGDDLLRMCHDPWRASRDYVPLALREHIKIWTSGNASLREQNAEKARHVRRSQRALAAGAGLVGGLMLVRLLA